MKLLFLSFFLLVLLALAGCQNSTDVDSHAIRIAENYTKHKMRYQKPGASLYLVNSQVNIATAGVQYAVDLDIYSFYPSGSIELAVKPSKGLHIVDGDTLAEQELSKGSMTFPYVIIAEESGRYYLHAKAKIESDDTKSFRSLSMIVEVGAEDSYEENTKTINPLSKGAAESSTTDKNSLEQNFSLGEGDKEGDTENTIYGAPVILKADEVIVD